MEQYIKLDKAEYDRLQAVERELRAVKETNTIYFNKRVHSKGLNKYYQVKTPIAEWMHDTANTINMLERTRLKRLEELQEARDMLAQFEYNSGLLSRLRFLLKGKI